MRRTVVLLLLIGWCSASAAFAQGAQAPIIEISGGLSSLASGGCCGPSSGTVPLGWDTGVSVAVREWVSLAGTIGGDYETTQYSAPGSPAVETRVYAFLAGPRFTLHAARTVSLFGQMMLGATHHEAAATVPNVPSSSGYSSVNHFAWQPGAGTDISLGRRWAVRFEGDYRITPEPGLIPSRWAITQPRFSSGIVFRP